MNDTSFQRWTLIAWSKEINLVSWNGREPKYDIRDWSEGHEKLGKGVTLTGEKVKKLRDILNGIEQ